MLALHYDIRLPRDYDMGIVRDRVATRGHALDDRAGLHLKAYLVRDVATGAPVSSYSPFYLWADDAAAAHFLWGGGGFAGIVRDFSRPRVQTWLSGLHLPGTAPTTPTRADLTWVGLAAGTDLDALAATAADAVREAAGHPAAHSATSLLDPQTWTLTLVSLRADDPGPSPFEDWPGASRTETFEVLHLSAPGRAGSA